MIEKRYEQFEANVLNQGLEVSDKSNVFQCMDEAYLWTFCLGFPKATIQRLYARQVYTMADDLTRKYFEVIPNTPEFIPRTGDLCVFDRTADNVAGHISVKSRKPGTLKTFETLDQNWAGNGTARLITHNYDNPKLLGVLRPKEMLEECLLPNTLENQKLYESLIGGAEKINKLAAYLGLGENADNVSYDTFQKSIAGKEGAVTVAQQALVAKEAELGATKQEVENRVEQVSRLKEELLSKDKLHLAELEALKKTTPNQEELVTMWKTQYEEINTKYKAEAVAKGQALNDLEAARSQVESLTKASLAHVTLVNLIKKLLNEISNIWKSKTK